MNNILAKSIIGLALVAAITVPAQELTEYKSMPPA